MLTMNGPVENDRLTFPTAYEVMGSTAAPSITYSNITYDLFIVQDVFSYVASRGPLLFICMSVRSSILYEGMICVIGAWALLFPT